MADATLTVLLADPPWPYRNRQTGGSMRSGAEAKYATLTLSELAALQPARRLGRPLLVGLWVPAPLLPDGIALLGAWRVRYVGFVAWEKLGRIGMGWRLRSQVELMLYGTAGRVPMARNAVRNVIRQRAGAHSAKPERAQDLLELMAPTAARRVEWFARRRRPGWECTGLELDGVDIREEGDHVGPVVGAGVPEARAGGAGEGGRADGPRGGPGDAPVAGERPA